MGINFNLTEHLERLNNFKEVLDKITKERNITLNDLCSEAKINVFYLNDLLNRKTTNFPNAGTIERIAEASKGIIRYDELMMICWGRVF